MPVRHDVGVLELRGPDAVVRIDPTHGGRVASAVLAGRERLVTAGDGPLAWGSYPMVPWAGRVRRGRFWHQGRSYSLPIDLAPHAIHGTGYTASWTVVDDATVTVGLGPAWPFEGHAVQRFALSDGTFTCTLEVHAHDEVFPAQVGWHPWFARPVSLTVQAGAKYCRDADGIPDGSLERPPGPRPWDDCLTGLTDGPRLRWDDGVALEVRSDCDHWVVYDEPAHALCVEPQSGPPDGLTLAPYLVEPGRPLVRTMTWQWS